MSRISSADAAIAATATKASRPPTLTRWAPASASSAMVNFVRAITLTGFDTASQTARTSFTLTARAENFFRGNPDLEDTIARLQAFERAGADVLFAPGLRELDEVRAVCEAVSKPVNVIARTKFTMAEIADAGAQRVSVGGRLAFVAIAAMAAAAEEIRDTGEFSSLEARVRFDEWLGD